MLQGRTVRLPVFNAAGNVDDCVLKYPPNGQPSQQRFLNWHCVLPGIACVRLATRPMNIVRFPLKCSFILEATSFSTQLRSMGGKKFPSGNCERFSFEPL